jgi:hypothetical protein
VTFYSCYRARRQVNVVLAQSRDVVVTVLGDRDAERDADDEHDVDCRCHFAELRRLTLQLDELLSVRATKCVCEKMAQNVARTIFVPINT